MKQALMIGAIAVAAATFGVSNSASAKTVSYGFGTPSGGQYCDGVELTLYTKTQEAVGLHTYYQAYCPYRQLYIGGFGGSVKALGSGTWYALPNSQAPASPESELYTVTTYINMGSASWAIAIESTYFAIPFEIINSGPLVAPLDASHRPKARLGTAAHTALEKLRAEGKLK